ncbi:MAG: radical SAM protein [Alphaproteobacteria bacterium]|nr:radical SAM protein [Alphaproteobacteria bacterium]
MSASAADPRILVPTAEQVDERLAAILARGNRKLGEPTGSERLLLMITRSCELRCTYCFVDKTETGQEMSPEVAERGVDLLMASRRPKLEIQFFGGEPSRRWDMVTRTIRYAVDHPQRAGRPLDLILTTNGTGLDEDRVAFLEAHGATLLFSLDGNEQVHARFRPAVLTTDEEAFRRIRRTFGLLMASRIHWFMNVTVPPNGADDVGERYAWARRHGVPRFQMNYSVGHYWNPQQEQRYLSALQAMLLHHAANPEGMLLYNWLSECEPVMLSDELIVDVDGTVMHDGAIFLERSLPQLKDTYDRGSVFDLDDFDVLRWDLARLDRVMRATYAEGTREHRAIAQNIRMGAAVDLVIDHVRQLVGWERAGLRADGTFGAVPPAPEGGADASVA